jgi:hypothetical protein
MRAAVPLPLIGRADKVMAQRHRFEGLLPLPDDHDAPQWVDPLGRTTVSTRSV